MARAVGQEQGDFFIAACERCQGAGVVFFAVEPALGRDRGRQIYYSCLECQESGEANYVGPRLKVCRWYQRRSRWVKGRWVKGRLMPLKGSLR